MSKDSKTAAERIAGRAQDAELEVQRTKAEVDELQAAYDALKNIRSQVVGDISRARAEVAAELEHRRIKAGEARGAASAWRTAAQLAEEGLIG